MKRFDSDSPYFAIVLIGVGLVFMVASLLGIAYIRDHYFLYRSSLMSQGGLGIEPKSKNVVASDSQESEQKGPSRSVAGNGPGSFQDDPNSLNEILIAAVAENPAYSYAMLLLGMGLSYRGYRHHQEVKRRQKMLKIALKPRLVSGKTALSAIELLSEVIRFNPGKDDLFRQRGRLYVASGKWREGFDDFDTVIETGDKQAMDFYWRGACRYFKTDRCREKSDIMRRNLSDALTAIELGPTNGNFYFLAGFFLDELGRPDEALERFAKALVIGCQEARDLFCPASSVDEEIRQWFFRLERPALLKIMTDLAETQLATGSIKHLHALALEAAGDPVKALSERARAAALEFTPVELKKALESIRGAALPMPSSPEQRA